MLFPWVKNGDMPVGKYLFFEKIVLKSVSLILWYCCDIFCINL